MVDQHGVAGGSRTRFRWIVGVEIGVLVGLLTDLVPFLSVLVVIGVVVALLVVRLRGDPGQAMPRLAGLLVGAGVVYLVFVVNTTVECAATADFCGDANVVPLWILTIVTLGAGGLGTIWARSSARNAANADVDGDAAGSVEGGAQGEAG